MLLEMLPEFIGGNFHWLLMLATCGGIRVVNHNQKED